MLIKSSRSWVWCQTTSISWSSSYQHSTLSSDKQEKILGKYAGPYKVIERIDEVAHRLDLSIYIKAHNVLRMTTWDIPIFM